MAHIPGVDARRDALHGSETRTPADRNPSHPPPTQAPREAPRTPATEARAFFEEYGEANRYSIREVVGKGSYGVVCSAIDNFTGEAMHGGGRYRAWGGGGLHAWGGV